MNAATLFDVSKIIAEDSEDLSINSMLSISPEIREALGARQDCVVAIAVSGGKDSSIAALYGWKVKHTKPKSLIKPYKKLMFEKVKRQARSAKRKRR